MHNLQMKDITILYEGNGAIHIPLPVAHECVVDTDQSSKSNENCLETLTIFTANGLSSLDAVKILWSLLCRQILP